MNNEVYQEIFKTTKEGKNKDYELRNNILYIKKTKKKVIQRWEMEAVLYLLHDHPISAHFGIEKTYRKAKERYFWPTLKQDVELYVKTCDQCQRRRKPSHKNELHPIQVKEPFYQIG